MKNNTVNAILASNACIACVLGSLSLNIKTLFSLLPLLIAQMGGKFWGAEDSPISNILVLYSAWSFSILEFLFVAWISLWCIEFYARALMYTLLLLLTTSLAKKCWAPHGKSKWEFKSKWDFLRNWIKKVNMKWDDNEKHRKSAKLPWHHNIRLTF